MLTCDIIDAVTPKPTNKKDLCSAADSRRSDGPYSHGRPAGNQGAR